MPFSRLIREDESLARLRETYANQPAEERRLAAQWEYDAALATGLVNEAVAKSPGRACQLPEGPGPCPGAVLALAIDPLCAPAILTVGSVEYQLGRIEDAMGLFLALPDLLPETEDLHEIIGEAGDFLLDHDDYRNAKALCALAVEKHPKAALFHDGLSYCAYKLGEMDEAIAHARRAVELRPADHVYLNDLGWILWKAGHLDEAEEVLLKAVAASPPDDPLARNNLADLRRQRRHKRGAKKPCPKPNPPL
jgi:tetratricopeptide (TPR) repeat protein